MRHLHAHDGVAATTDLTDQPPDQTPDQLPDQPPDQPDMPNMADNPDPLETGNDNNPLIWSDPHHITIGLAAPGSTVSTGLKVSGTLNTQEINLLKAAVQVWESVANVQFQFVDSSTIVPDIKVGLADLNSMNFIGFTHYSWNGSDQFLPGTVVTVEDPKETPVTTLDDGDLRYTGFTTTMLQDFEHELGHALGLDHNQDDKVAVMHPVIGSSNPVPNPNDIAAIQSLYGAPTAAPALSASDVTSLHALLAGTSLSNLA